MFDYEPSPERILQGHYRATIESVDKLGEIQTLLRSVAMVCSEVGNKIVCNEALAASDVVGDVRNSMLLLNDKILRDIRDGQA